MVTVKELRVEAKEKKIKGWYKMRKAELLVALEKEEEPVVPPSNKGNKGNKGGKQKVKVKPKPKAKVKPDNPKIYRTTLSNNQKIELFKQPFVVRAKNFSLLEYREQDIHNALRNGDFTTVKNLYIISTHLRTLPADIKKFKNLENFELNSPLLQTLPPEIGELTNLRTFLLTALVLRELPHEIGNLKKLVNFNLNRCYELTTLPPSIASLPRLFILYISYVQYLPDEFFDPRALLLLHPRYRREYINRHAPVRKSESDMKKKFETLYSDFCMSIVEEEPEGEEDTCPVCLDCKKNYVFDSCGHIVCGGCMKTLLGKCPFCKKHNAPVYYKHYEAEGKKIFW